MHYTKYKPRWDLEFPTSLVFINLSDTPSLHKQQRKRRMFPVPGTINWNAKQWLDKIRTTFEFADINLVNFEINDVHLLKKYGLYEAKKVLINKSPSTDMGRLAIGRLISSLNVQFNSSMDRIF